MSMGWPTRNRTLLVMYQQLTGGGCTNKFANFKSEIDRKIAELDEKKPGEFCEKCFNLRKTIINKDKEFKACSTGQSNQLKLIENHDIKDFINKCPTVPACLQKFAPRNKKSVAAKQESGKKCERNCGCEQKISSTAEQKARTPPRSGSETSSTGITQEQKSQNLSGQHDNRETSRAGDPALQTLQNVRGSSNSSEHRGEVPKNVANHQPNVHEQVETETRLSSPAPLEAEESNTHPAGDPSQTHSDQHPESGNIFQISDLHKKTLQHNVPDGQGSDYSTLREPAPAGESIGNQAHNDQSVTTGTSGDSTLSQILPANGEKVDEKSVLDPVSSARTENIAVDGARTHSADMHSSDSSAITTRTILPNGEPLIGTPSGEDAKPTIGQSKGDDSEVSGSKASDGEGSNHGDTHTKGDQNQAGVGGGTDNKNLCNEVTDYQSSNNGNLCNKGERSELMDNNANALGIFSNIFGVIQDNKDNVINTSIPVGIVLLLGLLFKVN
ncbi:hypothetical protein PVNG_02027 [Plasmodium vivax North Korean]|uniref:VIR protein n=1 Tax=Plasmodium vivax North Korean TaxID=1035514 RepID=A0A0J9TNA2_PLAVI|nr:hypothetical protein PVNG_02027 [Plasmodium vivax North Korean]